MALYAFVALKYKCAEHLGIEGLEALAARKRP
jgi:hypothetical protein